MKIVFFGTPEFAVTSLDRLVNEGFDIAAVVTMPDKIAGRGHKLIQSDVKKYALEKGIRVLQPEKLRDEEFLTQLRDINADLFIVIAFRMMPEVVWGMPPKGTFNLHGSLLPKYRGAAPINRAIMNGETETGVTTFMLNHEIDMGDIIEQRRIEIGDDENVGDIYDRLMHLGADMVVETVRKIENGTLQTQSQPAGEFIPAPKIFKADCRIDWRRPARDIRNQIRGLSPYPAAFCTMTDSQGRDSDMKVFEAALTEDGGRLQPGEIAVCGKKMIVGTGEGNLEIRSLQPSGKKRMETQAFLLGYHPDRMKLTETEEDK